MAHRHGWSSRGFVMLLALLVVVSAAPLSASAAGLSFADPAFGRVWQQSDAPVAAGTVQRSWLWGPHPIGVAREWYDQTTDPSRRRLVQYFDKARMEITKPDEDASSIWYVTNGLLVKELVSGLMQVGDDRFSRWSSSSLPVAGDPTDWDSPQYRSFANVATLDGTSNRASDRTGQEANDWIDQGGTISKGTPPVRVTFGHYETTLGHNIADIFWNWINDPANGITTYGSWVYPMGYPIAEPYWVRANVNGVERVVLIQLFERRVLTYTPDNDPAWRVEMGNVGRAYLAWFKRVYDNDPIWSPDGDQLVFESSRVGNVDVYVIDSDGSGLTQLTSSPLDEFADYWLPDGRIVFYRSSEVTDRFLDPDTLAEQPLPMGWTDWSQDGSLLAYPSGTDQSFSIRVRNADGSNDHVAVVEGGFCNGTVAFSPDNQRLAYCRMNRDDPNNIVWSVRVVNVDGTDDHAVIDDLTGVFYIDRLSWAPDSTRLVALVKGDVGRGDLLYVAEVGSADATPLSVATDFIVTPAWSPTSEDIAYGTGNGIYVIDADGSNLRRLTSAYGSWPTWSPDGQRIAYIANTNLAIMNADGSNHHVLDVPQLIQ